MATTLCFAVAVGVAAWNALVTELGKRELLQPELLGRDKHYLAVERLASAHQTAAGCCSSSTKSDKHDTST